MTKEEFYGNVSCDSNDDANDGFSVHGPTVSETLATTKGKTIIETAIKQPFHNAGKALARFRESNDGIMGIRPNL